MTSPPLRLAFGSVLWRIFFLLALWKEVWWWRRLGPRLGQFRRRKGFRLAYLVLLTPKILFESFLIAAIVTVALDLIVRLVAGPLVGRWYRPRLSEEAMGSSLAFRMEAHEAILDRLPARMAIGRRLYPGAILRTDRRVAFAPDAWDVEPWTLANDALKEVESIETPSPWGKVIRGIPDRVEFRDQAGSGRQFLVADPREVFAWYSEEVRRELDEYEPSAVELF